MINNPKDIEKVKQEIRNIDKKTLDKAIKAAEGGSMIKSVINWIDCKERLPNINGREGCEFLVIVKEENIDKSGWDYGIDLAWFGSYIDDFWDTCNDWCEGQEVHITHWAKIDVPLELIEKEGK